MSDRKQEGPGARKPACMLCHRVEADPDACGDKVEKGGLCAHVFCLFFATLLFRQEEHPVGLMGFLPRDIQIAVWRAAQKRCCVCGQSGATITCCKEDCERWFHLPCAKEGGCVNQYITPYRSYCPEHRPEQEVRATPEPGTDCPICMEPVEDRKTFETMVCPTCKRAWFHRDCIQGQAMRAGALFFQCPLCRDSGEFAVEMFFMGIRVPFRQPTWEDNDAFADLGERHSTCNARECLYPGGREEAEHEGAWQLLLCSSCAAEGTHRRCSGLRNKTYIWECDSCAGLGTSSRDEPELSSPSLARQSGQESAHGSSESQDIRPSSGTPVPSGLASPSPSPETSSQNSQQQPASQQSLPSSLLDTSSPSRSRPTYSSSPDPEDRLHSRRAGPDRRRNSSGPQGQDPNQPARTRSRYDRSSRTTSRAERPRLRETPPQTSPTYRCSQQQRRAQSPCVRSRSWRNSSSSRTGPRGERPRQKVTLPQTSPRHSHSRQQGWAQSPRVRSRRDSSSSRTGATAERPRQRETAPRTSPRHSRSRQQGRAQSPHVRSRRDSSSSRIGARAERSRQRETAPRISPRHSRSHQQGRAQSPRVRSSCRRDSSSKRGPRAERPRQREALSGTSPRHSRSRLQRRASDPPVQSRSGQDSSRRTAASAESPRQRGTPSGTSRRSSSSRQRRRASSGTSNSST